MCQTIFEKRQSNKTSCLNPAESGSAGFWGPPESKSGRIRSESESGRKCESGAYRRGEIDAVYLREIVKLRVFDKHIICIHAYLQCSSIRTVNSESYTVIELTLLLAYYSRRRCNGRRTPRTQFDGKDGGVAQASGGSQTLGAP